MRLGKKYRDADILRVVRNETIFSRAFGRYQLAVLLAGAMIVALSFCNDAAAQAFAAPAEIVAPNFPISYPWTSGTYHTGPHIGPSVANLDGDPELEILLSSISNGPILAFNSNGSLVQGWPSASEPHGFSYFAVADVLPNRAGSEVFAGHFGEELALLDTSGQLLPGWPRRAANYTGNSPAIFDVNKDGVPELFVEEETWRMHAYSPAGVALPGWPVSDPHEGGCDSQQSFTPTFIDLDRNGELDVMYANGGGAGASRQGPCIEGFTIAGERLPGFPVTLPGIGLGWTHFNVADVDADSIEDIVTIQANAAGDLNGLATLRILGLDAQPKRSLPLSSRGIYTGTTALGDLDGDGTPEIVAVTEGTASAFNGAGQPMPGWPIRFYDHIPNNGNGVHVRQCSVAIGDVDGDLQPDIVFCAHDSIHAFLFVLNRFGEPIAGSPYVLDTYASPRGPAIADIDADGRNEIVVATEGHEALLWVLQIDETRPHGKVEWQQFLSDAANTGRYNPRFPPSTPHVSFSLATPPTVHSSAGTNTVLEFVVENRGSTSAKALLSVSLPPEAKGRADVPSGCFAFETEVVCRLDGVGAGERRSIHLPTCTDTAGNFRVKATLRALGNESDYQDNVAVAHLDVSSASGNSCPVRQVPGPRATAQLLGPQRIGTFNEFTLAWKSFNTTGCSLRLPNSSTSVAASIGTRDLQSPQSAGLVRYQLECSGPYGSASASAEIQVVDLQLTFTSDKTSATVGSTVNLAWSSVDFDTCEASGIWKGALSTNGTRAVTVVLGDNVYSIRCAGAFGSVFRTLLVNGREAPASPPPNGGGGGSGGGGGNLGLLFLCLLSTFVISRDRCQKAEYQSREALRTT